MILGVYCFLGMLFVVAGLLLFPAARKERVRFVLLASLIILVGLVIFEALSIALGITNFGVPLHSSYPQDYLGHGPLGWLAMLLPLLAALTPLILAAWFAWKARRARNGP